MNYFLEYIVVFAVVLALCVVGLAISILLRKGGKFPETEVGSNKHMRKLGITCAKQDELYKCGGCAGCQ